MNKPKTEPKVLGTLNKNGKDIKVVEYNYKKIDTDKGYKEYFEAGLHNHKWGYMLAMKTAYNYDIYRCAKPDWINKGESIPEGTVIFYRNNMIGKRMFKRDINKFENGIHEFDIKQKNKKYKNSEVFA